ncbi:MAG TPA: DUF2171 domain-containing protein [Gemmataceae bacterium]|jgi:hypothetical protein|nr:DUF2171 domain-containing protein [Gemmataceae bacterium]
MSVKETVRDAGHKVAEKVEQAADWVKEKTGLGGPKEGTDVGMAGIKERMDVIGSCGNKLGVVDHVEGRTIKLTRNDSADGQHHFIPMDWVTRVDSHVHLSKNCGEAKREWQAAV